MDAYMSVKKIFVGGIRDKPITEEDLKKYFCQYGDIKDCVIMTDKTTQKSRGFAFVVFDDYDSVDKIVIQRFHIINGINVEVKKSHTEGGHSRDVIPSSHLQFSEHGAFAGSVRRRISRLRPRRMGHGRLHRRANDDCVSSKHLRLFRFLHPRVGNLGTPNPYPASAMTNAVSYNPGSGFGTNA